MEEKDKDMLEFQDLGLDHPVSVTEENKHRNDGKWCKIFREAQRPEIKQYIVGQELNGISQQAVSKIESRKILPDRVLEVYARLCHVKVDMIKNMPEVNAGGTNTFHDRSAQFQDESKQLNAEHQTITFNPVDKLIELCRDKDNLHREIIDAEKAQKEELKKMLDENRAYSQELISLLKELKRK